MWAADNIVTIHLPLYLLQYVSISLSDLEVTPVLYYLLFYKDILREHSNKLCAWAADNLASLDMLFLPVVE